MIQKILKSGLVLRIDSVRNSPEYVGRISFFYVFQMNEKGYIRKGFDELYSENINFKKGLDQSRGTC